MTQLTSLIRSAAPDATISLYSASVRDLDQYRVEAEGVVSYFYVHCSYTVAEVEAILHR